MNELTTGAAAAYRKMRRYLNKQMAIYKALDDAGGQYTGMYDAFYEAKAELHRQEKRANHRAGGPGRK